jgi:hypothetical protein
MNSYTGFVRFSAPGCPDLIEEIDVSAMSIEDARHRVEQELDDNYEPGGTISRIEQRAGLFA